MAGLDADDRIVLILHYWADLTLDAVAERLGWPVGTVKTRLHHGLNEIRQRPRHDAGRRQSDERRSRTAAPRRAPPGRPAGGPRMRSATGWPAARSSRGFAADRAVRRAAPGRPGLRRGGRDRLRPRRPSLPGPDGTGPARPGHAGRGRLRPAPRASACPTGPTVEPPTSRPPAPAPSRRRAVARSEDFTCATRRVLPATTESVTQITDVRVGHPPGLRPDRFEFAGSGRPQLTVAKATAVRRGRQRPDRQGAPAMRS